MKKLDPFYWYLRLVHTPLTSKKLYNEERAFVESNIGKHRVIQWLNAITIVLVVLGLYDVNPDEIGIVITSLIAPVMVMGTAWFAITFGSVPARLLNVSMSVTFWMYLAFKLSLTAMFIAIGFVVSPILIPVLALIYLAVDFSCTQYDTADGMKAGLDEMVLKHSRAALLYYKEHAGIEVEKSDK